MEPILKENPNKYTVFPIEYPDIWQLYKKSIANIWTTEDVDLDKDYTDFISLTESEQFFIKNVLAFFASSDGIVNENLVVNFYNEIQSSEIRQLYSTQIFIEAIHGEMYSLMIDTVIKDITEKEKLFDITQNNECLQLKANWAKKWITNGTFQEKLIAFLVVEGIFFSGSFCAIFWLKEKGKMPGLCTANEWISRDEGLHATSAILIYNKLVNKLSESKIYDIFKEAINIEKQFVVESLPVSLLGMNETLMCEYIEYIGDFWLKELKLQPIYNTKNPFSFMDNLALEIKTNFFDKFASYQHTMQRSTLEYTEDF